MQSQSLISVIIPVYNVAAYLDTCVETVLAQDYSQLDVILVDDGSPDNCGELCDNWASRDSRIRVVHKENGGLSSARNAGLDIASGEYIMFLDSDDLLHPQACSHLYQQLKAADAQIAIADITHVFGNDEPAYTITQEVRLLSPTDAIQELWYQKSFLPSACAKLYHRDLFQTLRFTQGILFEDIDLLHQIFWSAKRIVYTPSAIYGYTHRENSITTKSFTARDLDILPIAHKLMVFARQEASELEPAAKAYAVVAALRVALNAPNTPELQQGRCEAKDLLRSYGKQVLKDPNIRKKTRYGLLLYFYCRPLMNVVYKRVNRWK